MRNAKCEFRALRRVAFFLSLSVFCLCGRLAHGLPVDVTQVLGNETDPSIVINSLATNQMCVAAQMDTNLPALCIAYTSNGGKTWATNIIATNNDTTGLAPAGGEPSLAWDSFGNLFLAYQPNTLEGVQLAVSTNGGTNFIALTNLVAFDSTDQPRLTTPLAGVGVGTVWLVYKDYSLDNFPLVVQGMISPGLGTNATFGPSELIPATVDLESDTVNGGFASITVGPQGQVMVGFQDHLNDAGPASIYISVNTNAILNFPTNATNNLSLETSDDGAQTTVTIENTLAGYSYQILTNGGGSWGVEQTVVASNSVTMSAPISDSLGPLDYGVALVQTPNINFYSQGFSVPAPVASDAVGGFSYIAADSSGAGINAAPGVAWNCDPYSIYTGEACLVYTSASTFGGGGFDSGLEIEFTSSPDSGSTWSQPMTVDDDTGPNDHFLPSMAVDPLSGIIGVAWLDCRNDQGSSSQALTDFTNLELTISNFVITNITVTNIYGGSYNGYYQGSDTNVVIVLDTIDMYGLNVTTNSGWGGASNVIYLSGATTNFAIIITGTNTTAGPPNTNTTIFLFATNTFPDTYTTGSGNQAAVMYSTVSLDGGNSFKPNNPVVSLGAAINSPATGYSSSVADSGSLDSWGSYTGITGYAGTFHFVWPDNSDLTGNNPDQANLQFDIDEASTTVPVADLVVTVTNSPNPVLSVGVLVYTITVLNRGPQNSGAFTLSNILSTNVTLEKVTPGVGGVVVPTGNPSLVVISYTGLASGLSSVSTIQVDATRTGQLTNIAIALGALPDLVPTNNTNTLVLTIAGQDVAVGLSSSSSNVVIGQTVTNWIVVTNLGPAANQPIYVTNVLSPNWGNITVQTPGTFTLTNYLTNTTIVMDLGILPTNKPVTNIVTAVALGVVQDTLATYTVQGFSQDFDTNLLNNFASLDTIINDEDLGIGVSAPSPSVNLGQPFTYTISVTNFGPSYSGQVTVLDTLSTNLCLVGATQTQGTSALMTNLDEVQFNLGLVAANQTATLTVTVVPMVSGSPLFATNIASVIGTDFDTNNANNIATNVVGINGEDLAVGVAAPGLAVNLDVPFNYTITVTNLGLSTNASATVIDTISTNITILSISQSQGSNSVVGNQITFSAGPLGLNQIATLTVQAEATSIPVMATNIAVVSSPDFDTNLVNNSFTNVLSVNGEDLAVGIAGPAPSINLGQPYNFVISVTNIGLSTSGQITVLDNLSANLQVLSVQAPGSNSVSSNQITFNLGTLNAKQTASLVVTAMALGLPQTATNIVSASSTDFDTDQPNNLATNIVGVNGEDLSLALTAPASGINVGETVIFTNLVTNLGLSTNAIVLLTNTFSSGLANFTLISPAVPYITNGTTMIINLGAMSVNQTIPVLVSALAASVGKATNSGAVSSLDFDTNKVNNTAKAIVTIGSSPMISNLVVTALASSAFISWNTGSPATSQVRYGTNSSYGSMSSLVPNVSTKHVVLLTGLLPDTTYYYQVNSMVGSTLYTSAGSFNTTDTLILNTGDASYSGNWIEGPPVGGIYGSYYLITPGTNTSPTASATYIPNIPAAGNYDVSVWYPNNTNLTTNAPMYVTGASNEIVLNVNQTINGGAWVPLATNMYFASGVEGNVAIYNDTGATNKFVAANAMKWSYDFGQDWQTNGSVPAWWATYYFGATNSTISGSADPDGDGYSNYAEYVFGTDPTNPASHLNFQVEPGSNAVTVVFSPYQGGRTYQLQASSSLNSPWITLTNHVSTDTNGNGIFIVTQSNATNGYYRLSASVTP